ncbi:AAA family ATPase [Gracilibacillus sp. S3-1-1]|uniref:AAA family ATPase n=1 Tax=Gracilibacillus pellucidus TaxID=3095368 RepID=A0ACC6M894_9BACI|nr:AAA family ATPase [Gracilibacillus sp. S3-1-1]MDX8047184.1 AAA family ATPase [Gracilibacillus sp. S3-1-1]
MKNNIHILGASGSGTSTLGEALSDVLPHTKLDSDDYLWETKYTELRSAPERRSMLKQDVTSHKNWILSGAICGWGDSFKDYFDLVIFLEIPKDIRLQRLKDREFERYGKEVLAGGSRYEESQTFLEWAALYDTAGMEVRSKVLHEYWMKELSCPILRIVGDCSVEERVDRVLNYLEE